jgi:acyl-CoA thioester hydrolase
MPVKDFVWEERVRIYDTDTQGVVHYAGYYRFFTDALEQFAKSRLKVNWPLVNGMVWFVVVESHAKYHRPLRLWDMIRVHVVPAVAGRKALSFAFRVYKRSELACEGKLVMIAIDPKAWRSIVLPRNIASKAKKLGGSKQAISKSAISASL